MLESFGRIRGTPNEEGTLTNYRSFGIELECFHPTQDFHTSSTKIVDAIRAMGF